MTLRCVGSEFETKKSSLDVFRPGLTWLQQWKSVSNKDEFGHVRAISGDTCGWLGM
jgi:hypothetical protein